MGEPYKMGAGSITARKVTVGIIQPSGPQPKLADPDYAQLAPVAEDLSVDVEGIRHYMQTNGMAVDEFLAEVSAAKLMGGKWLDRLKREIFRPSFASFGTSSINNLGTATASPHWYSQPIVGT